MPKVKGRPKPNVPKAGVTNGIILLSNFSKIFTLRNIFY